MLGEKWTVYWNEYASDTYLFGSQITFHQKDDVEFNLRTK
jgi:accessory secretory protein Asp3